MNIYEYAEHLLFNSDARGFRRDALIHAAYHGDAELVRFLLPFIKPVSDITECGALHMSNQIGHEEVTEAISRFLAHHENEAITSEMGSIVNQHKASQRRRM